MCYGAQIEIPKAMEAPFMTPGSAVEHEVKTCIDQHHSAHANFMGVSPAVKSPLGPVTVPSRRERISEAFGGDKAWNAMATQPPANRISRRARRSTSGWISQAAIAAATLPLPCLGADAEVARQLAADRGCYNCHAESSQRNVRSFAMIAKSYESLRGTPGAEQKARDRMHHGGLLSHVAAHERLTEVEATLVVRWLFEGGS